MSLPLLLVDAFADGPFGGNSAAVCLLARPDGAGWMQAVAAELRQPATAFACPLREGDGRCELRWFVPTAELVLCGHGTLATAHAPWESGRLSQDVPARFETAGGASGRLAGRAGGPGRDGHVGLAAGRA